MTDLTNGILKTIHYLRTSPTMLVSRDVMDYAVIRVMSKAILMA